MSQYTSAMNTNDGRSALISDIASATATVHAQQVRRFMCYHQPWQQQAMHARDQKSAVKPSPLSATSCTGHVRWKTEGSTSMAMSQRTPSHCQGRQHVSDTKHKTQHHTTHICMQAHMHTHIPCQICVRGCPASCCAAAASSNSTGPADAHSVRVPRQRRWSVTAPSHPPYRSTQGNWGPVHAPCNAARPYRRSPPECARRLLQSPAGPTHAVPLRSSTRRGVCA